MGSTSYDGKTCINALPTPDDAGPMEITFLTAATAVPPQQNPISSRLHRGSELSPPLLAQARPTLARGLHKGGTRGFHRSLILSDVGEYFHASLNSFFTQSVLTDFC